MRWAQKIHAAGARRVRSGETADSEVRVARSLDMAAGVGDRIT